MAGQVVTFVRHWSRTLAAAALVAVAAFLSSGAGR